MMIKRVYLILLLSIFFSGTLFALDPGLAVTQYVLDTWTVDDGLPQNTAACIIQTHDGYLWVGTGNGLARFDGARFTVFNLFNTKELTRHDIRGFFEDRNKNLWIILSDGFINRFSKGKFENFSGREEFMDGEVGPLLEDKQGTLWFPTNKGLLRFVNGRFEKFSGEKALVGERVINLYEDSQNNLWIGTDRYLFRFSDGSIEKFGAKDGIIARQILNYFEDKRGNLWIGTRNGLKQFGNSGFKTVRGTEKFVIETINEDRWGNLWVGTVNGLLKFRNGRIETINEKSGLAESWVTKIVEDRDGHLWIGTRRGLYRCWNGEFESLKKENGLADNEVMSLYEDREGNLWIGTRRGLSRLKNPRVITYSKEEGLGCDVPRSIYQDRKGSIWISGDCPGIYRLIDGKFKIYTEQTGLPGLGGGCFYEDSHGFLWIGAAWLTKFKDETFEIVEGPKDQYIKGGNAIQADDLGSLWIGTQDGLIRLRDNQLTTFTRRNGLSNNRVNKIFFALDSTLWIGTNEGVTLYKDGIFKIVGNGKDISKKMVLEIYQDEESTIWLGTYGGLYRYRQGDFFLYTTRDGMVDDAIMGILEDEKKNLWMSSNHGIFYVKKKELHDFAAGRIDSLHPVSFDKNDGMKNEECNSGRQPSCLKSRDGKLWFPTMKGVVMVDLNTLQLNTRPPPVYIEKVFLDGERVEAREKVKVMPDIKRIEFHYTAVDFRNPHKIRFRYKLEGHDKQWIEQGPGKEKIAPYMNVPGGEYNFRVIASSSDGFWNNKGDSIAVEIIPQFHRTWWFKALVLLIFAVVFYQFVYFIKKYFYLFAFWKKKNYIGQYVIIKLIGCGAMATIFKAHRLMNKKKIAAVKILKPEYASREISKKRFKQEGAIIDRLDHPNIVKIFERGQQEDNLYIVMEYLEGQTLAERIKEEKIIKIPDFIEIMNQLAGVLSVLHNKNIIHRDLKPANIMLINREGTRNFVKLLDFGLARSSYHTRLTESGSLLGTILYIPPEQITHSVFSPAGDIYALGIIGYEMLTGMIPFTGSTDIEIIQMKLKEEPVEPGIIQTDIPPALNNLIKQMIARDFKARPTAETLVSELTKILDDFRELKIFA